ncbi:hypothetical protein C7I85_29795 [Mesorhizobium soli]|uniref:Histidine phosphatase family protein n=2 Tax=Pseudaminobacter soli (ex Li et al. 2025) TaxID=1295366 RepID=A0A2P7RLG6_9HYPH|nr:hypothetical protein C7I85_29795 [Mesorhizobium soli]
MVLPVAARQPAGNLADATVLILRHADKPDHGPGLSAAGDARAIAYARYFHPFRANGSSIEIASTASRWSFRRTMKNTGEISIAPLWSGISGVLDT